MLNTPKLLKSDQITGQKSVLPLQGGGGSLPLGPPKIKKEKI